MKKLKMLYALLALGLFSCGGGGGGGGGGPQPVSVSISPTSASVEIGNTLQFTKTVRNTSNTAVNWLVNDVAGGNTTVGTISASGLYTAPAAVPNPNSVTVKAVSQADTSKSASATVTITLIISISIAPTAVTLPAGATQQFTATVQNPADTSVTWKVNDVTGGNSTLGTISTGGLYTAPLAPPLSGTVTVTAASVVNPVRTASATVTIVFSNATLTGQYAFGFTGYDGISDIFLMAGSFAADGNGNITSGLEDLNHSSGVYENTTFTGSYSIGADGRGSMTLTLSQAPASWGQLTTNFRLVVSSNREGRVIEFDTFANGTGFIEKQDPSTFMSSALTGGYAFRFDGLGYDDGSQSYGAMSAAGRFTASGAGAMNAGVEDINNVGVVSTNVAFTGAYSVASTGRGQANVTNLNGTSHFSFYVISAEKFVFVSLDYVPALLGVAEQQTLPSFSNSALAGDYVFQSVGYSASSIDYSVGRFTADGINALSSGVFDDNDTGTVSENVPFTGAYGVTSNGRGTLTITAGSETSHISFYLVSPDSAFFVQTDSGLVVSGEVFGQHGGPFTTASLTGSYSFGLTGLTASGDIDISGQFLADGAGNLAGANDVNDYGLLTTDLPLTGPYTVSPNGRGTMTVTTGGVPSNQDFYLISPSRFVVIGVNDFEVLTGGGEKQF
ncbi:MAG: Ig-like domain-containing protein [Terriglobia bacterium]